MLNANERNAPLQDYFLYATNVSTPYHSVNALINK